MEAPLRPTVMRSRAPALAAVVAFALAVVLVAALADGGGSGRLVKLPVASFGGQAGADEALGAPSARSAMGIAGPIQYKVEGTLPDLPGTAPAYRLGSTATAAAVKRLATALGVDGEPKADGRAWIVRSDRRQLNVQEAPGVPWYLGPACLDAPVGTEGDESVVSSCGAVSSVGVPIDGGGSSAGSTGSAVGCSPDAPCATATAVPEKCPADVPKCAVVERAHPVCTGNANGECPAPVPAPTCPADASRCVMAPEPVAVPAACPPGTKCLVGSVPCDGASSDCVPPAPACTPEEKCVDPAPLPVEMVRPADLPSEKDARRLAVEAFGRLGVGTDGLVVHDGGVEWYAMVEAKVDGLPVFGMSTSVSIGSKGEIVSGNGFLAKPDRIGDYPLAGVDAGLRRLTEGFGGGRGGDPQTMIARDLGAEPAGSVTTAIEAPPADVVTAGGTEPRQAVDDIAPDIAPCGDPAVSCEPPPELKPFVQVITGAHLGLLLTGDVLVPAYVFELADDAGSAPVPAVTDQWLDQEGTTTVED